MGNRGKRMVGAALLLWATVAVVRAQLPHSITAEVQGGVNVPNYQNFPGGGVRTAAVLGLAWRPLQAGWARHYGFPHVGVHLLAARLGSRQVGGYAWEVVPYLLLDARPHRPQRWTLKLGLGAAAFTRPHHPVSNPDNRVIGSRLNWTFQAFLYRRLWQLPGAVVLAGGGYAHHSNAHTQLPNYGLNGALLTVAVRWGPDRLPPPAVAPPATRGRPALLITRGGMGLQERGGTTGPVGGRKWTVGTAGVGAGLWLRPHLTLTAGLLGRRYQAFYEALGPAAGGRGWGASAVVFYLETEFQMGHVGIEVAGGLNLHKPYYRTFAARFEGPPRGLDYTLKRWLCSRLGLNLYLVNTYRHPRHNVGLGAHINANFGQAEFADLSLRYVRRLGS